MKISKIISVLTITAGLFVLSFSASSAVKVPPNFKVILAEKGVTVYKKDHQSRSAEYVTIINLRQATLNNLTGSFINAPNGEISRKSIGEFWNDAVKLNTPTRQARVIVNGTFFSQNDAITPIAFGLKVAGKILSYGYGLQEFPHLTTTFSWNLPQKTATIKAYDQLTFDSSIPEVIGALAPTANKSAHKYLARTFVGVAKDEQKGSNSMVLFYSSASARQQDAQNILIAFGATSQAMLDGGGSTGLIIDGNTFIQPRRTIPHAIVVYSGQ